MSQSQFNARDGMAPAGVRPGFHQPPLLDMTPEGGFRTPPRPSVGLRLVVGATLLAVLAGVGAVMALALWLALALIPVAIVAAAVAYVAFRVRQWRAGGAALFRRQGGVGRPPRPM